MLCRILEHPFHPFPHTRVQHAHTFALLTVLRMLQHPRPNDFPSLYIFFAAFSFSFVYFIFQRSHDHTRPQQDADLSALPHTTHPSLPPLFELSRQRRALPVTAGHNKPQERGFLVVPFCLPVVIPRVVSHSYFFCTFCSVLNAVSFVRTFTSQTMPMSLTNIFLRKTATAKKCANRQQREKECTPQQQQQQQEATTRFIYHISDFTSRFATTTGTLFHLIH